MNKRPVRLMVVDDFVLFRSPLAFLLDREPDLSVVAQASTLAEARAHLDSDAVDLATVDLDLPDGFGADLIHDLRHSNADAVVLVLTASHDQMEHARAIEAGAAHVMHKSASIVEIVDAIRRLVAGEALMSQEQAIRLLNAAAARHASERIYHQALATLTPEELGTLRALADGLDQAAIAQRFSVNEETVRARFRAIMSKLNVDSRLQAVLLALRHGFISLD
jgi:DNA-binding NarL/FixJ family response regulator